MHNFSNEFNIFPVVVGGFGEAGEANELAVEDVKSDLTWLVASLVREAYYVEAELSSFVEDLVVQVVSVDVDI